MKNLKDKIAYFLLGSVMSLGLLAAASAQGAVTQGFQGGTGIATSTAVGQCLQVLQGSTTSSLTWTIGTCGSGGGGGIGNVLVLPSSSVVANRFLAWLANGSSTVSTSTPLGIGAGGTITINNTPIFDGAGDYIGPNIFLSGASVITQNPTGTTSVGNLVQGGGVNNVTSSMTLATSTFCNGGLFVVTTANTTTTITIPTMNNIASSSCGGNIYAGNFSQQLIYNSSTANVLQAVNGPNEVIYYTPGTPTVLPPGASWSVIGEFVNVATLPFVTNQSSTILQIEVSAYQTSTPLMVSGNTVTVNGVSVLTTSTFNSTGTPFNFPYWNSAGNALVPTTPIVINSTTPIFVGINTLNPLFNLDVKGTSTTEFQATNIGFGGSAGGSGLIGSTGIVPAAKGDRLGFLLFGYTGGTSTQNAAGIFGFADQTFIPGVNNGSYLELATTPDNTASRTTRVTIAANGNVAMGFGANVSGTLLMTNASGSTTTSSLSLFESLVQSSTIFTSLTIPINTTTTLLTGGLHISATTGTLEYGKSGGTLALSPTSSLSIAAVSSSFTGDDFVWIASGNYTFTDIKAINKIAGDTCAFNFQWGTGRSSSTVSGAQSLFTATTTVTASTSSFDIAITGSSTIANGQILRMVSAPLTSNECGITISMQAQL